MISDLALILSNIQCGYAFHLKPRPHLKELHGEQNFGLYTETDRFVMVF